MIPEIRMLYAIGEAERMTSTGARVVYVLESLAEYHQVPRGELAELLLAKSCECSRARAEREAMKQADAELELAPPAEKFKR